MHNNLEAYRVFYYVAQYRSFTKAAELLHSNQPNVTRSIKNLEQALGCALFHRSSRNVFLTPEGEALYAHIAPAMEQIRLGEESIHLYKTMQSGTVSIGVSEIALHQVLLPLLENYRQQYPGIRLRILNSNSKQALSFLKDNLVDFAVLTLPVEYAEKYDSVLLTQYQETAVCGTAFANRISSPLCLEQLANIPLISLCRGSSTRSFYTEWFQSFGLSFNPDIEAATSDQILPLVQANLGIGFVPEQAVADAVASGSVIRLPLEIQPPLRTISLLRRKDTVLSLAATKLLGMILSAQKMEEN